MTDQTGHCLGGQRPRIAGWIYMDLAGGQVTLGVTGMSCMHCVKAIKAALGQLDGVKDVQVDLEAKTVSVDYDESLINRDVLVKALGEAGYGAED